MNVYILLLQQQHDNVPSTSMQRRACLTVHLSASAQLAYGLTYHDRAHLISITSCSRKLTLIELEVSTVQPIKHAAC